MSHSLGNYQAVCEAIALLLPNQIEVVMHDLRANQITYITTPFSKRVVGDDSLIDMEELKAESAGKDVIGPYSKISPDGEPIKSVTAIQRDELGEPVSLVCMNMKTGAFTKAAGLLMSLIQVEEQGGVQPLMSGDWREQANEIISQTLNELGVPLVAAKRTEKLLVITALEDCELFQIRGSVEYIAKTMGVSRAGLYSLLREVRTRGE